MKIRPGRAELYHADGRTDTQTDVTKQMASSKFCQRA
jgi:hypothetical protein